MSARGWAVKAAVLAACGMCALGAEAQDPPIERAFGFLARSMDRFHERLDVYTDLGAAGNHFPAKAMMPDGEAGVAMDEGWANQPLSGTTCIRCSFRPGGQQWGGFYFLNGALHDKETEPQHNWGEEPNAGLDLRGATAVTFHARGDKGGERVEFFVGGVGWRTDWRGASVDKEKPHPDSLPKVTTSYLELTRAWKRYSIPLRGRDLRYVIGGFGWATNSIENNHREITFYLDDISWDKPRPHEPRFIVSYVTEPTAHDFDNVMRNVAFTYDNALALLAFLARGTPDGLRRARLLAEAFIHAARHDRFYSDGRLRNAYSGGPLALFPGWTPNGRLGTARMPGFWHAKDLKWYEDRYQVSTDTGNMAWAMIALLAAAERLREPRCLAIAEKLGTWVEEHCRDARGKGGYTRGLDGWEPDPAPLPQKATEHNLDLYVAFQRLYEQTGAEAWRARAMHARAFVQDAMWDAADGKLWTGTLDDGVAVNKEVVPLDVQPWAILALGDDAKRYLPALAYAERHHAVPGGGFHYRDKLKDAVWYEGTAQMAAAYQAAGQEDKAAALLRLIEGAQRPDGAIPAASKDNLDTGFGWAYFRRGHLGATAWYILAKLKANPFWLK